jgi:hypothetical protein
MKSIALIILTLIIAVSFAACSDNKKEQPASESQSESITTESKRDETESETDRQTESETASATEASIVGTWERIPMEGEKHSYTFTEDGIRIYKEEMFGLYDLKDGRVTMSFAVMDRDPLEFDFDGDRLLFDDKSSGTGFERVSGESGNIVGTYRREDDGGIVEIILDENGKAEYSTTTHPVDTYKLEGTTLTVNRRGQDGQFRLEDYEIELSENTLVIRSEGSTISLTRAK